MASNCTGTGLNLVNTGQEEFHGVSIFGSNIDVSVTGAKSAGDGYILFDGMQLGPSQSENMYLDQQNETVICAANCQIKDADENATGTVPGAVVIGPDAATVATGLAPVVFQLNQGAFYETDVANDIYFANDLVQGQPCNCRVALGSGMFDANTQAGTPVPGTPTTNDTTRLTGQTLYAPPTFANAASAGVPLTLNPNELGIGASSDTVTVPGAKGLKFRVECSTAHPGTAKLVVLAGTSNTETVLADGVGNGVTCSQ